MSWAGYVDEREEGAVRCIQVFSWETQRERDHLEDTDVDVVVIFKRIFKT
jgi:hypothetical protein